MTHSPTPLIQVDLLRNVKSSIKVSHSYQIKINVAFFAYDIPFVYLNEKYGCDSCDEKIVVQINETLSCDPSQ